MSDADDAFGIRSEVRLQAVENLLINSVNLLLQLMSKSRPDVHAEFCSKLRQSAAGQTVPELDPAMSDLAAAEFYNAVDRLAGMIERAQRG